MPTAAVHDLSPGTSLPLRQRAALDWAKRPLIMGVLNLTPDSFSDGGRWLEPSRAVDRARAMVAEGADLLDLGAESTRPGGGVYGRGAAVVPADEEIRRLLPVLEQLRQQVTVPISVDTRKAEVARAALASGADIVNDISALGDPGMASAVAQTQSPIVLMHSRGSLESMQRNISFDNVVDDVVRELTNRVELAVSRGIDRELILVDPGIGFGKTAAQNLELLRYLDRFRALGRPVVVGASRKSFLGEIAGTPVEERLPGSLAAAGWAARHAAAIVRVHDVAETSQFLAVWQAIATAGDSRG